MAASAARRRPRGFTLVEVLVALFIMAILAAMAFRGIDALAHARDGAQAATDRSLKLNSGISQFEYDVSQITDTQVVNPIDFNGNTLRLTRRTPAGITLVVWTLQDKRWQRWASPPVVHVADLQTQWMRTQQWTGIEGEATPVIDDVTDFQVYCYRNGWSNCQSSSDAANPSVQTPATPPSTPSGGGPVVGSGPGGTTVTQQATVKKQSVPPTGIQILLTMPGGNLMRERELPPL